MNPCARRPLLRRFAAWVLLAWVLSLASGVANACMAAPHALPGEARASCHDADDPSPADTGTLTACVKFCDDFGAGTPTVKPGLDAGPLMAMALQPALLPPAGPAAEPPLPAPDPAPPPWPAVPIRLAFLHLAR